jgi:arylsulfatase A-like enzyme
MCGLPLLPEQHCDGESIVPLLKETGTPKRDSIFWHYPHYGNQGGTPGTSVRSGDFKLLHFHEDNHMELYNLKEDISEQNDLSATMPEKVLELRNSLEIWKKDVGAILPQPNPDYHPRAL